MRLESACKPVFARHETFHPRYGWVKKAYDAGANDPHVFNEDLAVVRLGVGKNMVKSIRHWGHAFRVLTPVKEEGSRVPISAPTVLGRTLFADKGWDPYCELPGTLWLLHWLLVAPGSIAPVWWLALTEYSGVEFTEEELQQYVLDRTKDWADPTGSSVKKDVSCFLRMYSSGQTARATFDDLIDCPFRELGLVQPSAASADSYRFWIGPKPSLPPAIAAYACLDFISRTETTSRTATISFLTNEHGSPGKAFKLPEEALIDLLTEAARQNAQIELTSAAGVPQLTFDDEPGEVATNILWDSYRQMGSEARGFDGLVAAGSSAELPSGGRFSATALEVMS